MESVYTYRARDADGRPSRGTVKAADEAAALEMIRAQGLLVTHLAPEERAKETLAAASGSRRRMNIVALSRLSRHLSVMLQAGVGLSAALHTLAGQAEAKPEKQATELARVRVDAGVSLAKALAETGGFPPLFIYMVEAGEASGRLDEVLARLADYYERDHDLRQRVKGALTYPAVVAVLAVIVVIVMMTFVVPRFVEVLEASDVPLPAITRAVFGMGTFFKKRWYLAFGIPAAIVAGFRLAIRTDEGRRGWDSTVLRLPVMGKFATKVIVVRFSETLSTLVASGVPILESLDIVERVVGNTHIALGLRQIRSGVREGAGIAGPLAEAGIFPPVVSQMIAIGEESGAVDEMLAKLAGFYGQEVDRGIKSLTSIIEPVVIAFMGLIVALIAAAVVLPMFQMVEII